MRGCGVPPMTRLTVRAKMTLILGAGTIAVFLGVFLRPALAMHYGLSFDPQYQSCLPWSNFFIRYGHVDPKPGELVLFHDRKIDVIADNQRILVVKMVAGIPGDRMKITKTGGVWIAGPKGPYHYWGKRWLLPWVRYKHLQILPPGVYTIPAGKYLLMGTTPGSYDGRYWGFVPAQNIIGKAWPI